MIALRLLQILFVVFLLIPACTRTEDKQQEPAVFKEIPQIQEIKPEKPSKIKLKRDKKDEYSWEISGDNVDEILKIDKKLRKAINSNQ